MNNSHWLAADARRASFMFCIHFLGSALHLEPDTGWTYQPKGRMKAAKQAY